jgi:acetate kinase
MNTCVLYRVLSRPNHTSTVNLMKVLVMNAGSSSQKSSLYELGDASIGKPPALLWEAQIDWNQKPKLQVKTPRNGAFIKEELPTASRSEALGHLLKTLWSGKTQVIEGKSNIDMVGHRVVHGGPRYTSPTLINAKVKEVIKQLSVFAPLHNRASLEGIEAVEQGLGSSTPQIAVFDTAFHSKIPLETAIYPGPYDWFEQGIRRYGFHGISHQYCAEQAAKILDQDLNSLRLITCHLGNGCSLAAIRNGYSVDTTMGFTPLEGLMMGSRSGSVDPGILLHLMRQGSTADQLETLLNQESGLKGISGLSNDMRVIVKAMHEGNERAKLAFDMYIHRLRSHIGSMLATLGGIGIDALVFTAGVGENAALVREKVCEGFEFIGLTLDLQKNRQSPIDQNIATEDSLVQVLVIHTQEDWAIVQACWKWATRRPH